MKQNLRDLYLESVESIECEPLHLVVIFIKIFLNLKKIAHREDHKLIKCVQ